MKTSVKKSIILLVFSLTVFTSLKARHIAGGEMSYQYVGPGSTSSTSEYRITLRLYRDCQSTGAQLDPVAAITIYDNDDATKTIFRNLSVVLNNTQLVQLVNPGPCIDNAPIVCYQIGSYFETVELPINRTGYTISYQRCCRIDNIANIVNSTNAGATYTATIPGTSVLPKGYENSTPVFNTSDTVIICENNSFFYNFSAVDKEKDDLTYTFAPAYDGGSQNNPQPTFATPPPYTNLGYSFGFSPLLPMGTGVSINERTGLVSGIAPNAGVYVLTVAVIEKREGKIINVHRKDLHIKVAPCTIASADLQPEYVNCDGFTLTFQNRTNSPLIKTFNWNFGIPGIITDTSDLAAPTFTFPDTGTYTIRLITNRGIDCSDTAYTTAKIYPGFFPKFTVSGGCKGVPLQFFDQTTTTYGVVDKWEWSFGNPQVNPDGSTLQNPVYTYPVTGTYQAQFIVGNSKGCLDTLDQAVNVLDKPVFQVTNDTLICDIDTLQLNAVGIGTWSWTPNVAISNTTIPNPLVSPDVPTKYYVTLTAAPGCVGTDSVFVDVKRFVTLSMGPDTTICLTDSIRLQPSSDALSYSWTPSETLSDPGIKNPFAKPAGTTTYTVTGNIGKCQAIDQIIVRTVPYPDVTASDDAGICYGTSVQLQASGSVRYQWIPFTGLTRNDIPNPVASPLTSTAYIVAGFEDNGCPKPGFDTVLIRVIPPIQAFAGNDTAVVVGQPLQLNATGEEFYEWSPTTGLNNPQISNPIALLNDDIVYAVKVSSAEGCFAIDSIRVRVFKTAPDIFVPTAFTPNGDNLNDFLVPIPVGISSYDYFKVYNRWGQLVFSTQTVGKGWDGKISGRDQGTDTFVWYVRGTDYTGKVIFKKGTATLIR
jgi:gliding motility-associated-like protein